MIDSKFWNNKKVYITGHTGFKGSWLTIWLHTLHAAVFGYSLEPPTAPSLFEIADVGSLVSRHTIGDIRDIDHLADDMQSAEPDIVFHLAAQPLVRESYTDPLSTISANIMGTAHVLEAVRRCTSVTAVVVITTDKCYENKEWVWGYREQDALGGYDPYSSSKACSELITAAYRRSFFNSKSAGECHSAHIATARAGNVIGGGDYAKDRLLPDIIRSLQNEEEIIIRNPYAIRPWQHVLEPLYGYLLLAESLSTEEGEDFTGAWNFGPTDDDAISVEKIVEKACRIWGYESSFTVDKSIHHPHESQYLKLDTSKARQFLGWHPVWNITKALQATIDFEKASSDKKLHTVLEQIDEFE